MVYLHRIYTKSGDAGETSLGDGTRVAKADPRIIAYGGVDELNAVVGVALTVDLPAETAAWLRQIQNDLFDVGADLCVPESETPASPSPPSEGRSSSPPSGAKGKAPPLRVTAQQIERLERWIDSVNERLEPLESFVLPGGTPAAAHLHHARTVCRRVEITVLQLARQEPINPNVCIYLNRLSDLLFVLARLCNNQGKDDILWIPGQERTESGE